VSVEYAGGVPPRYNLYLGQAMVAEGSLRGRLEDELRRNPGYELYLKGDSRLTYGAVRKVMELCHAAGFAQVKLATEELKLKH
jgi:biopolymer transport protein ExbD